MGEAKGSRIKRQKQKLENFGIERYNPSAFWGRHGFDSRYKPSSACREGSNSRKSITANLLVGENADYALAA